METPPLQWVEPGSFDPDRHFYPRVLNAELHPLVDSFLRMDVSRIVSRYGHLHPAVDPDALHAMLLARPRFFRWGGSDLFLTANDRGDRTVVVIETNSCPSGQKSMPAAGDLEDQAGYRMLLERAFLPSLKRRNLPQGQLAVLYDKNPMENTGYAAALADLTDEAVALVYCGVDDPEPRTRFTDGVLEIRGPDGWLPIRAAFRYVTQKPWDRIPPVTRTLIFNPTLVCLAGGRNKLLAAKAYDLFNAEIRDSGLQIRVPETIWDISHAEVPFWVERMGGVAVVKDPYSNAGQGVFTITNPEELAAFMNQEHTYDRFIVQALIGNSAWSSVGRAGRLYHVGTVPNRKNHIYAADLRFMVGSGRDGFFPLAMYARRAASPLVSTLTSSEDSWSILGTNLSLKNADGSWSTETKRLLLMDNRDFNKLGLGLDDLLEGYVQTILSITAIDKMAQRLVTQKNRFRRRLFRSLNPDPALCDEVMS